MSNEQATPETSTDAKSTDKKPSSIFFTGRNDSGPAVAISLNASTSKGAPKFVGTVGEQKVAGYIRNGSKGPFIAFVGERQADGNYPQLGFGNIIVNKNGNIRLTLRMTGAADVIWTIVDEKADQELLVECGLNLEILEAKRAAAKA